MSSSTLGQFPIHFWVPWHRTWNEEEWDNVLSHLPLSPTDPWTSLLVTGTLAIINPEDAYSRHGHGHRSGAWSGRHTKERSNFGSRLGHHRDSTRNLWLHSLHCTVDSLHSQYDKFMQLLEMSCRVKALQLGFLLTKHETYIYHTLI